jgi:ABC-2 type transport system ATP-binding protein
MDLLIIFHLFPSGLDPISLRMIWDAIHLMKKTRVVVLTTHNMEEADYLGDDIMIMHHGQVRAHGDPM